MGGPLFPSSTDSRRHLEAAPIALDSFSRMLRRSSSQKRRVNARLLLRSLDPARLSLSGRHSPWGAYASLFPSGYNYSDLTFRPKDLIALAYALGVRPLLWRFSR